MTAPTPGSAGTGGHIHRAAAVGGGLAAAGTASSLVLLAGAPWQAVAAVVVVIAVCGTVLGVVQTLVPQESRDRVIWSRDRLRHRAKRRSRVAQRARPRGSTRPVPR
jgi:hypothetical protein